MSDEVVSNETIQGRSYRPPVFLSSNFQGIFKLPPGSILDVRPGTFLYNGTLLDNIPNGNLIQGSTWPSPDTNTATGTTTNSLILSSTETNINDSSSTSVIASRNFEIDSSDLVAVIASWSSTTSTITNAERLAVIASGGVTDSRPSLPAYDFTGWVYYLGADICTRTGGSGYSSGFIGSRACSIVTPDALVPPATSARVTNSGFVNSSTCTINTTGANAAGVNGAIANSTPVASTNCNISTTPTAASSSRCLFGGSHNCNILGGSSRVAFVASTSGNMTSCVDTFLGGSVPTATSVTNCFVWGTTSPTASNQACFGTDLLVNNNRDLTITGGFSNVAQGHITAYRQVTTGTTTLLVTDGTIKLSPGTTLTLPLATTMAANYPLDVERKWTIISDPITAVLTIPPILNVTAPNLLNGKNNWTSHLFRAHGQRLTISLVNTAGFAGWYIVEDLEYIGYVWTVIDNNFGLVPPQSDANQLTTSTNQATHEALGAASYVTFENLATNSVGFLSLATPGFSINISSGSSISYQFDIFFSGNAAGNYLLRCDLVNTTTGIPVPGSYTEIGGANGKEGQKRVVVIARGASGIDLNMYQLRISRDTVDVISVLGSIRNVSLRIQSLL